MDYKQKYEQALENIKKIKAANKDNKELVDFIEYQYPELKESEDEKMIKFIKGQLFIIKKTLTESYELDAKITNAIDWLNSLKQRMKGE